MGEHSFFSFKDDCKMISLKSILFATQICVSLCFVENEFNKGWQTYFGNEPSEFHDLPLSWSTNNTVPAWLYGSYMKNGPAQKSFDGETPYRYYGQHSDSWAKIHKITFNEGKLAYSGRMLESPNYIKCRDANEIVPTVTFGPVRPNDWTNGEYDRATWNGNLNPNVAFHKLGPESDPDGVYMATTDVPHFLEFDPHTLEATGELTFNVLPRVLLTSSAHWRREVGADTSLNFHTTGGFLPPHELHFSLDRFGKNWEERENIVYFNIPFLSLIHQFSNTPNYAVIMFYPTSMDAFSIRHMHPLDAVEKLDEPTTFLLIDLSDGTVIDGFESWDPALAYATHHANAYEEDGEIILDVSCNPWDALNTALDVDIILNWEETGATESPSKMKRIRLDLATKNVVVEDWDNELDISFINTFDFPIINPQYNGLKHRYVYGWAQVDYWHVYLVKKDLEDSSNDLTWFLPSHYPHETVFVPNPDGVSEDDGVLITVVFDGERETSYLLLLDAITLTEINKADLPFKIPFPLHGQWFPNLV